MWERKHLPEAMVFVERALRKIGRHPYAGGLLLLQMLLVRVSLVSEPGPAEPWWLGIAGILFVLQLPAALLATPFLALLDIIPASETWFLEEHARSQLAALVWLVLGCVNYVLCVYCIPVLSAELELRWPFERTYRRLSALANQR